MEREIPKKKKVLFVITKSNWGGAQRYVYDLATGLSPDTTEVSVLLGGTGQLKDELHEKNIRTISMPELKRDIAITADIKIFFQLVKLFKKEHPDVVHLNSSKVGGLGALAARIAGVPNIIFTAHGWAFNEERGFWQKNTIKLLSWITVFLTHHTITVSAYDKEQGEEMPFVAKKISLIHNGIANITYLSKIKAQEEILPAPPQKETLLIGTVAELHRNKGVVYAIEAMDELAKIRQSTPLPSFLFIVMGEGEERVHLEALVKQKSLENHILFVGHKENASHLLKAFDIFLLPSVKEGLPYVLLEAGMAGLPTVSTNVGGIPEIISDMGSGILVRPKHPKELADALSFLLEHKKKREEFGINLQENVKKTFSIEKMTAETTAHYQ